MLSDILGQAIEAMKHNRRRTMITIVGMAWGIATVVLLLAYGAGFGQAFENIFAQFGTNMIGVFPGRTSEQAGGSKAGVQVRLTQDDVERIELGDVQRSGEIQFRSGDHRHGRRIGGHRARGVGEDRFVSVTAGADVRQRRRDIG